MTPVKQGAVCVDDTVCMGGHGATSALAPEDEGRRSPISIHTHHRYPAREKGAVYACPYAAAVLARVGSGL